MTLIFWILLLPISFYALAVICDDHFVPSLKKISQRLNIPSDAAGATLMALGSSAPELFVSLIALFRGSGHAALGAGNIVGSAIFQFMVIIGATAIVRKANLNWQPAIRDAGFYVLAVLLLLWVLKDGQVTVPEALYFIGLYVIYLMSIFIWNKLFDYKSPVHKETRSEKLLSDGKKGFWHLLSDPVKRLIGLPMPSKKHYYGTFAISILMIAFFSWLLVESAVAIAQVSGIPEVVIALIIVAGGNSIPDLLSSLKAAKGKMADMAISNAVGSNNFDILIGLGLPWLLWMAVSDKQVIALEEKQLFESALVLLATVSLFLVILLISRFKLGRITGYTLLGFYGLYILWILLGVFGLL